MRITNRKRFIDLPNRKRRDMVFALKQRIRKSGTAARYYTDQYLDTSWADFEFPSVRDKNVFWNATIETCGAAQQAEVWGDAFDAAYENLTPAEQEARRPIMRKTEEGYTVVEFNEVRYEKFEGRTFLEQIKFLQNRALEGELKATPRFRIDRSYRYGIGLHITVDEETITHEAVERAIDAFYALGETNWTGESVIVSKETVLDQNPVATLTF